MYAQYLEVKPSKTGNGTFTTVRIPSNVPVLEMAGKIVLDRDIIGNADNYLQVGVNTFLAPSGQAGDTINHSCDPNCKMHVVGNRAILYSLYVIPAGAQLTFDYSTTSTDTRDSWQMECKCGSNKCRGLISGFQYLNQDLQESYLEKNMVPLYITQPGLMSRL